MGKRKPAHDILRRNVRRLLVERGRSQVELAEALGMSQGNVSLILNAEQPFQTKHLDNLARFFAVPVPILFIDADEPWFPFERRSGAERRRAERRSGMDRREDDNVRYRVREIAAAEDSFENDQTQQD